MKEEDFKLTIKQKKLIWADHIIQDAKTSAGVSKESLIAARRIIFTEYVKSILIYTFVFGAIDFVNQITSGIGAGSALINTFFKYGLPSSLLMLVGRVLPYRLILSFARYSPLIFLVTDLTFRTLQSGSFVDSLFSWDTALDAGLTFAIFVAPPYVSIPAVAVLGIFNITKYFINENRYKSFYKTLGDELLKRAEMAILTIEF